MQGSDKIVKLKLFSAWPSGRKGADRLISHHHNGSWQNYNESARRGVINFRALGALQKHKLQLKRPLALRWDHDWCAKMKIIITLSASKRRTGTVKFISRTIKADSWLLHIITAFPREQFSMLGLQFVQETIETFLSWLDYWVNIRSGYGFSKK